MLHPFLLTIGAESVRIKKIESLEIEARDSSVLFGKAQAAARGERGDRRSEYRRLGAACWDGREDLLYCHKLLWSAIDCSEFFHPLRGIPVGSLNKSDPIFCLSMKSGKDGNNEKNRKFGNYSGGHCNYIGGCLFWFEVKKKPTCNRRSVFVLKITRRSMQRNLRQQAEPRR